MIDRDELFQRALALNGIDKKYSVTIDDNRIITRVRWMDATFFAPETVSDQVKEFEYIVEVDAKGKYREIDKSVSTTTSAGGGKIGANKQVFYGKQITFDKTIGVGEDRNAGTVGVINNTFYSEEYKAPVKNLLKECGYKKKMSNLAKLFIITGIFAIAVVGVVSALFLNGYNKEPINNAQFEEEATNAGYETYEFAPEQLEDNMKSAILAVDNEDAYEIQFITFDNAEEAEETYSLWIGYLNAQYGTDSGNRAVVNSVGYNKFDVTANGAFVYMVRIDDTILYVQTAAANEDEIDAFTDKIGY